MIGGSAVETISTVASPPAMPVPVTVAARSPEVSGSNENLDAASVRVAVALPAVKLTVCERSEVPSQDRSWTMVTVASSAAVAAPCRVRVKSRSSSPAPMRSWSAAMETATVTTGTAAVASLVSGPSALPKSSVKLTLHLDRLAPVGG